MTKRDLFKIAIRLFALLSLITILFQTLPSLYQAGISMLEPSVLIMVLVLAVIHILIFRLLFLYTHKIVNWLRLDKGFDDEKIIFGESNLFILLRLSFIIFGLYIIVANLPSLLSDIFFLFKSRANADFTPYNRATASPFDWYYYLSSFGIAIVLISYNELIASKLTKSNE